MKTEQRHQMFVKHKFQKTMIMEMLLITFILVNLLVVAGFLLLDHIPNLHQHKETIALAIAAFEVIAFGVVYRFNLRASHRIAGPLFNLQRKLEFIENADISFVMEVRHDDQFHELSEQMNKTVSSLRVRVERLNDLATTLMQQPGNQKVVNELIVELNHFKTGQTSPDKDMSEAA